MTKKNEIAPLSLNTDSAKNARRQPQEASLSKNIGDKFMIGNFIDTSGKPVTLDLSKANITIIDFWFDDCPPCIKELKQFKDILLHKENKVQVISVSINTYPVWKNLFIEKNDRFDFLNTSIVNWQHVDLATKDDPQLKHTISSDRVKEITDTLNVSFFPAYFVLDNDGKIIARPISAVEYIKNHIQ